MKKYSQYYSGGWNTALFILLCFGISLGLGGCAMDKQKASSQADEDVYNILDKTWHSSFEEKADYRLNETGIADPNNAALAEILQAGKLSLAQSIQLAVAISPEYQAAKEQLYLTGLDQTDAEHLYEITPFASLAAGQSQMYGSSSRTGRIYSNEIRGGQGTAGIQQLLATGAVITSDITLGSFDIVSGNYRSGPVSVFQTAITQPLLRGADRKVVLETLTQAQRNTVYEVRAFNRFRKTFYASVADDYYRLLKYSQQVYMASENLLKLKTLLIKIEALSQMALVPQYDLERARQNAVKASDDYHQIKQVYEEAMDLYKNRLLIPQNAAIIIDTCDWYELEKNASMEMVITEQQAVDAAMTGRLDLANAFDQVEDARRHAEVAADALGADLALVGLVAPASRKRFTFGADPADLQRTEERYELSLRANLPLDRDVERNNYKRTLIVLMQAQRAHQQLSNQVEMEVRKAWRNMAQAKNRMAIQKQARQLANKRLDNTLLLLQYAKANVTDMLDAERDCYAAQDNYAAALTDFGIAKIQFLRDTEMLWITPEGQHEQKIASQEN